MDDNRDTATSCAQLLKGMGHEVQTAYDGLAALEAARSFKPQAILLDIGLPGMNGFEVAKTLRDEGFANEVIVAVSGYGQPEDRRALARGRFRRSSGEAGASRRACHRAATARRAARGSHLSSRAIFRNNALVAQSAEVAEISSSRPLRICVIRLHSKRQTIRLMILR